MNAALCVLAMHCSVTARLVLELVVACDGYKYGGTRSVQRCAIAGGVSAIGERTGLEEAESWSCCRDGIQDRESESRCYGKWSYGYFHAS